jgi:hypothetical protein
MKSIQKAIVVGLLAASLSLGILSVFAHTTSKNDQGIPTFLTLLTRKVNEYEGQH